MKNLLQLQFGRFDFVIPLVAAVLAIIGIFTIQSTVIAQVGDNPYLRGGLVQVQVLALVVGFIVFIVASNIRYEYYSYFAPFIYVVVVALLFIVLVVGEVTRGSTRWFEFGLINFQPSSVAMPLLIICYGTFFNRIGILINKWRFFVFAVLIFLIPALLILLEPDLGSMIVLTAIWLVMIFLSPLKKSKIVILVLIAVISLPIGWNFLAEYQKARITSFINPTADPSGTGYNLIQSIIAVGSGQFLGRGWGRGTQSHLQYLPEQHTDFVFATFAEEQGFLGATVLILLYLVLLLRIFFIGLKAKDLFGGLICYGMFGWLLVHVAINIGMNIGIAPITGIPLPLISYGGTSIVTVCLGLGIVQSVYRNQV